MIRFRLDLTGKKPPELIEAYDSPNDKTIEDLAKLIAEMVDINKYSKENDNQKPERNCTETLETNENNVYKTITIDEMPEILTAKHIAEHLHLSKPRVYELMRTPVAAGGMTSFAIGKSKRVLRGDFLKWIEERKTEQ